MTEDDFQYAIENTRVILAPERQIASFGSTSFRFYLISELMDQVNEVRVRDGRIHAERPQILTPEHYCRLLLEGFGEKAQKYVAQLREPVDAFFDGVMVMADDAAVRGNRLALLRRLADRFAAVAAVEQLSNA